MSPPTINDTTLQETHLLVKFSIHSSTQISSRTSAVLSNLQQQQPSNRTTNEGGQKDNKPTLVILTAKSKATSKLISIVEIAKRELAAQGVKCFQYNALTSELLDVPRKKAKVGVGKGSESEDAFETMGERELGEMKKRNVPIMTVYLSTSSVRDLKMAYG